MEVFILSKKTAGYYDLISNFLTPSPKVVEGLNNSSYLYYISQLHLKLFSIFNFENFPTSWNLDYFRNVLFSTGYIGIFNTTAGVLPLLTGYEGINVYNFPTKLNTANPVLGNVSGTIGETCELVYFNYVNGAFLSVQPLITRYATLLASCDGSISTSLINSRIAHIFYANTDAELKTYQRIYDDISKGKPAVFLKKTNSDFEVQTSNEFINVKNTYIANDIILTKRSIMNEFLTEIGINNFNSSKRERLITDEVNANNYETKSVVSLWVDTLNACFSKVNSLFDLNIKVTLKSFKEGGEDDELY